MQKLLSPMLAYKNNTLHVEGVSLAAIAKQYGTPCYVYSAGHIRHQLHDLQTAFAEVLPKQHMPKFCYATKANSNINVLKVIKEAGGHLEIVSEGELFRGLKAGFKGSDIVMTGIGKQDSEIRAALSAGIKQLNLEAIEELETVNAIAAELGVKAPVAFRLNPNIAAGGDDKIMTGRARDKFGLGPDRILEAYEVASKLPHLEVVGLSMHIGSQIHEVWLFRQAYGVLAEVVETLREEGYTVPRLDIGGGFGIAYQEETPLPAKDIAEAVRDIIVPLNVEILMEPGRFVVGNSGVLLSEVINIKHTTDKSFLVCDFAMNDIMRPSLYNAWHSIVPVVQTAATDVTYDIVGPVCETGDTFARERALPALKKGDLVAVQSAGAYCSSMASNYNSRPMAPEVLVEGDKAKLIRRRQTFEDLIALEV